MRMKKIPLKLYQNIDRQRYSRGSEQRKYKYLLHDDYVDITQKYYNVYLSIIYLF